MSAAVGHAFTEVTFVNMSRHRDACARFRTLDLPFAGSIC